MKKFIVILIISAILAGLIWLAISIQQRLEAREARRQQAANEKFAETKITLIEGWSNDEMFSYLAKLGLGSKTEYAQAQKDIDTASYPFLSDKPSNTDLQGYLFPDTYRVSKNARPQDVVDKLLATFEKKFGIASADSKVSAGFFVIPGYENIKTASQATAGLTLFELVTLASIVEKETGRPGETAGSSRLQEERQTVAGVFLNRLARGQALQSDATVNYITKSGRASSTQIDTEIDSPYNTYKYQGLPPGPIANPSYSSLFAVLHPVKTDFFYFLHSQSTGEVYYANTLEEHNQNKAKYLK